jgi:hypothetical protein
MLDDGNGGSTLTFTAHDENGTAVAGLTDIQFVSSLAGSTISPVEEMPAGSGIYVAKLTSTTAGKATVVVQQGSVDIAGLTVQEVTFTHKA